MTEFNDLLKEIGLTRREFADMIGITYASMNVMLSTGNTPKWVTSALIVARRLRSNEALHLLIDLPFSKCGGRGKLGCNCTKQSDCSYNEWTER
jgi:hypothetical protein